MAQKDVFSSKEGDEWYRRNKEKISETAGDSAADRLLPHLLRLKTDFASILEIGCSNGTRLEFLRRHYNAKCHGIEPSAEAVAQGCALFPDLLLCTGTAEKLPHEDGKFDLVIFGFCLYLCDRGDLFKIACEADRVLKDEGILAILDFHPPFAYRNDYAHFPGMFSYKMDYSKMFSWNPVYTTISESVFGHQDNEAGCSPDERVGVSIMRKDTASAYPRNPFSKSI